jgi:hypothetical protein
MSAGDEVCQTIGESWTGRGGTPRSDASSSPTHKGFSESTHFNSFSKCRTTSGKPCRATEQTEGCRPCDAHRGFDSVFLDEGFDLLDAVWRGLWYYWYWRRLPFV